jgi:hypothetical protein
MLRFEIERSLMAKRWRAEWEIHGRDFGGCHCGKGPGTMRKHRPRESHPSSSCGLCDWLRLERRRDRRRERYTAREQILEQLVDV